MWCRQLKKKFKKAKPKTEGVLLEPEQKEDGKAGFSKSKCGILFIWW